MVVQNHCSNYNQTARDVTGINQVYGGNCSGFWSACVLLVNTLLQLLVYKHNELFIELLLLLGRYIINSTICVKLYIYSCRNNL